MLQALALSAALAAVAADPLATGGPGEEIRVLGRVELDAPAADAAARERLDDQLREQFARHAAELLERQRPFWLPETLARRSLDRWLGRLNPLRTVDLVDSIRHRHDHGGYQSYRTELVVRPDAQRTERLVSGYAGELRRTARRFGGVVGGSVVLWGLCGFLWLWFDRLTRGYMTGRLGLLFAGMGVLAPGIALVFV